MCPCVCAFAIFFRVVCFVDQDIATLIDVVVMRLCVQRIVTDAAVMSLCTGIDAVVMCVGVRVLM